ncbi:MAG: mannitol dehydrogenase family protein [Granulosicoccus sp.]|nr:mannitol dehydrogenase family protein [Granulosicoccus sp.]
MPCETESPALLQKLEQLPDDVQQPDYPINSYGVGIVHFGLGAFHKAHQAFYTDAALAQSGGDWKIVSVSLRSAEIPRQLNEQRGLFTLITRSNDSTTARVVGSIDHALSGAENSREILELLVSPSIRIVTSTITEKGYGIDPASGEVDLSNPVIVNDLDQQADPQGFIGFIVRALLIRRLKGIPAFTVLCCDNLPDNGQFLRSGVLDFAQRYDSDCASWIADNVTFPSSMVDRITPAPTADTRKLATQLTGVKDLAAIECEPFHQWVIEDKFPLGMPDWSAAGALLTQQLRPYEQMKLRMLNGTHSLMAYGGFLTGCTYIRDVMANNYLRILVRRHLLEAMSTLEAVPGIELSEYANELESRFSNTAIAHETFQIAMDGSQKMPQRIFSPAVDAIERGQSVRSFALATALWIRYCAGKTDSGVNYTIQDPRAEELSNAAANDADTQHKIDLFSNLEGLIPPFLINNDDWNNLLAYFLDDLWSGGVSNCLEREARRLNASIDSN